jgi:hypothetical protein
MAVAQGAGISQDGHHFFLGGNNVHGVLSAR